MEAARVNEVIEMKWNEVTSALTCSCQHCFFLCSSCLCFVYNCMYISMWYMKFTSILWYRITKEVIWYPRFLFQLLLICSTIQPHELTHNYTPIIRCSPLYPSPSLRLLLLRKLIVLPHLAYPPRRHPIIWFFQPFISCHYTFCFATALLSRRRCCGCGCCLAC